MLVLGIETSCDDTAVAIVRNGVEVLSNIRESQPDHDTWGGVVPEIAARLHAENWKGVLEQALVQADVTMDDIDAIAVTQGPGLQTSLLTGTTAGSFLSLLYDKPLIPVQHILGHVMSVHLGRRLRGGEMERCEEVVELPSLVLTVSGGHTQMHLRGQRDRKVEKQEVGKLEGDSEEGFLRIEKIGQSLDDACGEAFDKLGKMLGLGYPGGPIVSRMAEKGDSTKFKLPNIYLEKESLDFSFSGLKAACRRIVEKEYPDWILQKQNNESTDQQNHRTEEQQQFIYDLCASFEMTVSRVFIKKIGRVLDRYPEIKQVHFVGGVSANKRLQSDFAKHLNPIGIEILSPIKMEYCTDNAAMIACAGYFMYEQNNEVAQCQFIESNSRMSL